MAGIPDAYLDEKIGEAYERMVRDKHVKAGVERGLRAPFEAAVDKQALAAELDRLLADEVRKLTERAFEQATATAWMKWRPPHMTARVDFLADDWGEWEVVGSAEASLDAFVKAHDANQVRDMAADWDFFAEAVGHALVEAGAVEAPEGWERAVCRRPSGLDEYVADLEPARK